jgi:hypothetical protein
LLLPSFVGFLFLSFVFPFCFLPQFLIPHFYWLTHMRRPVQQTARRKPVCDI